MSGLRKQQSLRLMWTYIEQYAYITIAYRKGLSSTVMPTLPLLAGDLHFFVSSPALPTLVHESPAFYVHYKYWILSEN